MKFTQTNISTVSDSGNITIQNSDSDINITSGGASVNIATNVGNSTSISRSNTNGVLSLTYNGHLIVWSNGKLQNPNKPNKIVTIGNILELWYGNSIVDVYNFRQSETKEYQIEYDWMLQPDGYKVKCNKKTKELYSTNIHAAMIMSDIYNIESNNIFHKQ